MNEHTPTPWIAAQDGTIGDSEFLRMIGEAESYTDAEHIVRCVNAHDELVAALERARVWLAAAAETFGEMRECEEEPPTSTDDCINRDSYCERSRDMNRAMAEVDVAIAKARGES